MYYEVCTLVNFVKRKHPDDINKIFDEQKFGDIVIFYIVHCMYCCTCIKFSNEQKWAIIQHTCSISPKNGSK